MIDPYLIGPITGVTSGGPSTGQPTVSAAAATGGATGGSSSTGSSSPSASATPNTNALLQPNQFLTLLVDSLKYQDPLNPTSSADFLTQLASLSQVETLQSLNTTETSASQASQIGTAAGLLGHSVSGIDAAGTPISGTVTGVTETNTGPTVEIGSTALPLSGISTIS